MKKEDIFTVLEHFDHLHDPHENNLILGDFNFVDFDVDKGKNMSSKDQTIKPIWDHFLGKSAMVDPFRLRYPSRKIFSFSFTQGKSRGDRVYVSENNVSSIKNIRYINTPFPTAHKVMTFDLQDDQKMGPGSWKMNSSVLTDEFYKQEIEEVFHDLESMDIQNPIDWWDMFITVVQGTTKAYTKRKARIKNSRKRFLENKIQSLEENENPQVLQTQEYSYYKGLLNEIINDEIRGHDIRTTKI
jgi:hypothetical protein